MRIFLRALSCALLIALGIAPIAHAQQTRGNDRQWEKIEVYTMWKMIDALNLDSATADKILAIRHQFLARRKEIKKALDKDLDALRQSLNAPSTDDAELARLIQSVREKRKELVNLHGEQYDEVAKILPLRKQAELILFFKDFRKELRALRGPQPPGKAGPLGPPNGPPLPGPGPLGPGPGGLRPPGLPPPGEPPGDE